MEIRVKHNIVKPDGGGMKDTVIASCKNEEFGRKLLGNAQNKNGNVKLVKEYEVLCEDVEDYDKVRDYKRLLSIVKDLTADEKEIVRDILEQI